MTNEEKILLEDELWRLEIMAEGPGFITKEELARIKEIKKLLKAES